MANVSNVNAGAYGIYSGPEELNPNRQPASQAPTPTTPTAPASPTYMPRYTGAEQAASDYQNTFTAPESEDQIYAKKASAAQAEIDNLNRMYDGYVQEQQVVNAGRSRGTASVNTLTGLGGSTEANATTTNTDNMNKKDVDRINAERGAQIAGMLSKIRSSAVEESRAQRLEARQSSQDILASRTARQTEAVNNLTQLAKSGVTLEGLKQSDPESYDFFTRNIGDAQMKALISLNRPQETIIDKRVENGKYIFAYQNPIDGKVRIESVDLGFDVPPEYGIADLGGQLMFYDKADPTQAFFKSKTMTPDQAADNHRLSVKNTPSSTNADQLYAGLSSPTATAVRSKVGKYSSEPLVQNFATIQEGYNFATSIATDTKNPADDQALIYALAKALDPGSVVREGEYATAQKYAQSWINAYGKGISQAVAGTGFLSRQARENIKKTIETKYNASRSSYNNTNKQYIQNINNLTGRSNGDKFLVDYATSQTSTSRTLTKDGKAFDASGLTDEEYQEALADGYVGE